LIQTLQLGEPPLGIVEIDPSERGLETDILRLDCKAGFGDANVGLRAFSLGAAFGRIGECLLTLCAPSSCSRG
jgi:hypothetical protein